MTANQRLLPKPQDLVERAAYELLFLESVLQIREETHGGPGTGDFVVFSSTLDEPKGFHRATSHVDFGDWRPGFSAVGSPLTFVTAFKVLDMFVEWLLYPGDPNIMVSFKGKSAQLDQFDQASLTSHLSSHAWLCEAVFKLFKGLYQARNVVIHRPTFALSGNGLSIEDLKANPPTKVTLTSEDVVWFGRFIALALRCASESWLWNSYQEFRLRNAYAYIAHLVGEQSSPSPEPRRVTAVVVLDAGSTIDMTLVHARMGGVRVPNVHDKNVGRSWTSIVDMLVLVNAPDRERQVRYFSHEEVPATGVLSSEEFLKHATHWHVTETLSGNIDSVLNGAPVGVVVNKTDLRGKAGIKLRSSTKRRRVKTAQRVLAGARAQARISRYQRALAQV